MGRDDHLNQSGTPAGTFSTEMFIMKKPILAISATICAAPLATTALTAGRGPWFYCKSIGALKELTIEVHQ